MDEESLFVEGGREEAVVLVLRVWSAWLLRSRGRSSLLFSDEERFRRP